MLAKLSDGKAGTFKDGTIQAFERHGELPLRTLTADNGKEFAARAELTAALGLDVYFARPYHAWERGTNENTNGLVRQFFPNGLDLRQVTPRQVAHVERLPNTRPRKCLGYRTPLEVLRRLWLRPRVRFKTESALHLHIGAPHLFGSSGISGD